MNLSLYWLNPAIHAACGYKAYYRRKGASTYTLLETSGSTSGSTSVNVTIPAPASYEGYVISDCCSDNFSTLDAFGVNGYGTVRVTGVVIQVSPLAYIATIASPFPNPYAHIISGTFTSSMAGTVSYTATYPANSTTATVTLSATPVSAVEVITNIRITAIDPQFNNGGQVQQLDPLLTPSYFEFYSSGTTSGVTIWNGAPSMLPSFTLDSFTITEVDVDSNPIAGDLVISWAHPYLYAGGVFPYDDLTFIISQFNDSDIMSTVIYTPVKGLNTVTLPMVKTINPITPATSYKIRVFDAAGTVLNPGSYIFYLPDY